MIIKDEAVRQLNDNALNIFKLKGDQNSVKVRRILQLTEDLSRREMSKLRILDLGCAEGVYSIEAALRGAEVVGIDGRSERMDMGRSVAQELGLKIKFLQEDVRNVSIEKFGKFDVIYFLGLLYHLDSPDVFTIMPKLCEMCDGLMIIDTHIALEGKDTVSNGGIRYKGEKEREHNENESSETVKSRLSFSQGNTFSFHFTKESLVRLLRAVGFTSVMECYVPFEMTREKEGGDRITLVAIKGSPIKISSYPWLNDMSDEQIEEKMKELGQWRPYWTAPKRQNQFEAFTGKIIKGIYSLLGKFGYKHN